MDSSALLSSIAALRNSVASLNRRSGSLESWLYFWVALVALGVVAEVCFVIWEYFEDREAFHRGTIRSPQKPRITRLMVNLLAAAFVAGGVTGEFVIDIKAGSAQTELRNKNEELNTLLGNASGLALKDAAGALERAAVAESHLAQAKADAESAKSLAKGYEAQTADSAARARAAESQVASANAMAAEARAMAESERLERVRLEALVAPRSLSAGQIQQIAAVCRRFVGHRVSVTSYGLDVEGAILGGQLVQLLTAVLGRENVLDNRASQIVAGGFELGVHVSCGIRTLRV